MAASLAMSIVSSSVREPSPCGGRGGFASGVSSADDDNVVIECHSLFVLSVFGSVSRVVRLRKSTLRSRFRPTPLALVGQFQRVKVDHIHLKSCFKGNIKRLKPFCFPVIAEGEHSHPAHGVHEVYVHPVDAGVSGRCPEAVMRRGDAFRRADA